MGVFLSTSNSLSFTDLLKPHLSLQHPQKMSIISDFSVDLEYRILGKRMTICIYIIYWYSILLKNNSLINHNSFLLKIISFLSNLSRSNYLWVLFKITIL